MKQSPYRSEQAQLISESLMQGESLTSSTEHVVLDKYQNIIITEKTPTKMATRKLTTEERILKDFIETGKVVWHTTKKAQPIKEMDLDFKIVAALHSLKQANRLHYQLKKFDADWRRVAKKQLPVFMEIFERFEDNLREEHDIILPDTEEEIKQLRDKLREENNEE